MGTAVKKAAAPEPRKPTHQAPTHSGLSVVSSVLWNRQWHLGQRGAHLCPPWHTYWGGPGPSSGQTSGVCLHTGQHRPLALLATGPVPSLQTKANTTLASLSKTDGSVPWPTLQVWRCHLWPGPETTVGLGARRGRLSRQQQAEASLPTAEGDRRGSQGC